MIKDKLLVFALLFWGIVPATAQIALFAPSLTAKPGEEIEVNIKVTGYDSIIATQFAFAWDTLVLEYQSVGNFNPILQGFNSGDIGAPPLPPPAPPNGVLTMVWVKDDFLPVSVPDSQNLFSIYFKVIGNYGTMTDLEFLNDSSGTVPIIEAINSDFQKEQVIPHSGYVMVDEMTALSDPYLKNGWELHQNFPNPFNNTTNIPFILEETSQLTFRIHDVSGKEVFSKKLNYPAGSHYMSISSKDLPAPGTYFYSLEKNNISISKEMIYLK